MITHVTQMELENLNALYESAPPRYPKASILLHQTGSSWESVLDAVANNLGAELVSAPTWESVLSAARRFDASCVIMPLRPEELHAFLSSCTSEELPLSIVFILEVATPAQIIELMQLGAAGVISPSDSESEMQSQLDRILSQNRQRQRQFDQVCEKRGRVARLNEKEKAVLKNVLLGLPNKAIAKKLEVSQRTIESRRHDIFLKTETGNLVALARLVFEANLDVSHNGQDADYEQSDDASLAANE
jgi:FixJ family two-component response regulator